VEELKKFIEGEKVKNSQLENEMLRLQSRISHLEDLIKSEKERVLHKER
jgi:predicted  nucleic acid-binding Zn-ribbon protein